MTPEGAAFGSLMIGDALSTAKASTSRRFSAGASISSDTQVAGTEW